MNNLMQQEQQLFKCGNCHRELPQSDYYTTRGKRDSYCKCCRKSVARGGYLQARRRSFTRKSYLVITEIDNRDVRMMLIKNALQKVHESIERKSLRNRELDYQADL